MASVALTHGIRELPGEARVRMLWTERVLELHYRQPDIGLGLIAFTQRLKCLAVGKIGAAQNTGICARL